MRKLIFVRKMATPGRYDRVEKREILKTTLLYHDGKTQVPKKVIELLNFKPGESTIVWVKEEGKIFVESAKQRRGE